MEADLILLEKNPAEDISNIQFIDKVFLRGKIVFSQKAISSYDIPEYSYPPDVSCMKYIKSDESEMRVVDISDYAEHGKITQVLTKTIRRGLRKRSALRVIFHALIGITLDIPTTRI